MKKAFVNCEVAQMIADSCKIEALPLLPYKRLDKPVSSHADMLVYVLEGKIFTYEEYYEQNKTVFDIAKDDGYELLFVSKECKREYPNDIALNVLTVGKNLFGNLRQIAPEVIKCAEEYGYKLVNVKQGYSACSTLVLNENNIITADQSIYKATTQEKISSLFIASGEIELKGYDYGFIGGASFVLDNVVYFLGDIKTHSEYEKIKEMVDSLKMSICSISSGNVFDFGGIRFLD